MLKQEPVSCFCRVKGELFGVANMMRFKDGCFLDDVWKQNRRKSGGLDIHETTKLKEKVIRIGADKCEEILEEEPDLDNFLEPVGGSGSKTEELSGDQESRNESSDNEAKDRLDLEIEGQAVNHGDLFRSDRGGAAIEEGEEGFDEEMGIQTQNVFAVYEQGGMELPENPQDGNFSDAEDVSNQNVQGVDNQQAGTSPGSVQPRSAHADAFRFEETEHAVGNVPSAPTRTQQGQASSIPSKIKLVGTIVSAETQSPAKTTFSAADLFLPTYGKKKSKKGKKKKK